MDVKITLPLLPLRDIVVFPSMVIPLFVGRDKSISALNEVMKNLGLVSILSRMGQYKEREKLPMQFETKTFYTSNGDEVFTNCDTILRKEEEGLFPYEIDGLIFTPADKGVGSDTVGEIVGSTKKTWNRSI